MDFDTTSFLDASNYRSYRNWNVLQKFKLFYFRSDGTIHDFAGPYFVSVNDFAFGKPLKYVRLDNSKISDKQWDEAILKADAQFEKTMHILCTYQSVIIIIFRNNCHSHVA